MGIILIISVIRVLLAAALPTPIPMTNSPVFFDAGSVELLTQALGAGNQFEKGEISTLTYAKKILPVWTVLLLQIFVAMMFLVDAGSLDLSYAQAAFEDKFLLMFPG